MVSKAPRPVRSLAEAAQAASSLNHLTVPLHCVAVLRHPRGVGTSPFRFRLFTAFVACFFPLNFICSEIVLLFRQGTADIDAFALTLTVVDTDVTWFLRIVHTAVHEHNFHKLALQVGHDFAEFLTWEDLPLLVEEGRRMRRFTLTYISFGIAACANYFASPVSDEGLPYVLALPYDATRPFSYVATFVYCVMTGLHVVVVTMVLDCFNVSLISQLRMQLMLLNSKLVSLAREVSEKPKQWSRSPGHSELHYRLVQCIRHHQAIIKNADLLETTLGAMLLGQSISIGASACFQMFQCVTSGHDLQETGKYFSYVALMLAELFIYCWFGDDLITESENLALAAYEAVTTLQGCPLSIQRLLLLLMQRAQRPLRITAGGFFSLSRESFVSVVNVSYSFSAILRNFSDEE